MGRQTPSDYLNRALAVIEARALRKGKVDWKSVRAKTSELAADAKNTADTYPAINFALEQLGDQHSFLVGRNGKGTKRHTKADSVVDLPKRVHCQDILRRNGCEFGFLLVEQLGASSQSTKAQSYARSLQERISDILISKPSGWIVDLRGNGGGNMWPMIVGIGPVLGSGTLGFFQYSSVAVPWFYCDGQSGVDNARGRRVNFKVSDSLPDCAQNMPVAILIDKRTASSGEAVAISFRGRSHSRFFGHHTCGLSTSNESFRLSDGATLYLTTSVEADRDHNIYDSGISPDNPVGQGNVPLGDVNDPVIQEALDWLAKC